MDPNLNLVLVGMPGAGKSTVGVLVAKVLAREFADTDLLIQAAAGQRLHVLIESRGVEGFRELEEATVAGLDLHRSVIATGGSVVYGERAMTQLRRHGRIVWLRVPLADLAARLGNFSSRGVLMQPGQTLAALNAEREPLYARYADAVVDCEGLGHEQVASAVIARWQTMLETV